MMPNGPCFFCSMEGYRLFILFLLKETLCIVGVETREYIIKKRGNNQF